MVALYLNGIGNGKELKKTLEMKANLEQLEKMQKDLFKQQCYLDIQKAIVKHLINKKNKIVPIEKNITF